MMKKNYVRGANIETHIIIVIIIATRWLINSRNKLENNHNISNTSGT